MPKKENRIGYLLKNTAIFAIGNITSRFIFFFLVPLYTNVLSKSQYGTVDLINTVNMVFSSLLVLNIGEGILRFSLDKDANNDKIMGIGIIMLLGGSLVGVLILPVLKLNALLAPYAKYIYFYTVTTAGSLIFLCNLKGKEKLVEYSVGNIINTLAIALLNIIFLVVLKKGVEGYFSAYSIANVITIIYAFFVGGSYKSIKKFTFDRALFKNMIKYSVVLMPNTFIWWVINSSDRVIITSMLGIAANGIYAVSYKLPTILSSLAEIFNKSWMFSAVRENDSDDVSEYSSRIYNFLLAFLVTIAIAVLLIMKPFMKIYVESSYYEAWKYVPYLIVGFVFLSLATFFSNTYVANKDSKRFLISSALGAIINIILNMILIPFIKIHGAALATCISYMVVFVYRAVSTRRYVVIDAFKKKYIFVFLLLILTAFTSYADYWISEILMFAELIIAIVLFIPEWKILWRGIFQRLKRKS